MRRKHLIFRQRKPDEYGPGMKSIVFFFLLFLTCGMIRAQISFGIKGGLNISDVVINNVNDPDAESDFNFKLGLHGGFFAIAEVGGKTGLSAELLYSNKGVRAINNINLHYITLPVFVRYLVAKKLIVEGGPELGYLLAAKSRYGNVSSWNNQIDLGLDIGMQYYILSNMMLGLRFNAGISNVVNDTPVTQQGEKIRYQNRVLQLSIGYTLYKSKQ